MGRVVRLRDRPPVVADITAQAPIVRQTAGRYRLRLVSETVFGQAGGFFQEPGTPLGTFRLGDEEYGGGQALA